MTEAVDDLSAPLGQQKERRKRRLRLPFSAMQALAALLGLFLLCFIGFALFSHNPLGGEPIAHVALQEKADGEKATATPAAHPATGEKAEAKQAAPSDQKTVTIIDGSSGKRENVVIGG